MLFCYLYKIGCGIMKKKIISILIYVVICLIGANVLFLIFNALMNKPYVFNWFSCVAVPIIIGVFTYVILDKFAKEYSVTNDLTKDDDKELLGDEYEDYLESDEETEDDEDGEEDSTGYYDDIVPDKKHNDIYDFDEDGDDRNE